MKTIEKKYYVCEICGKISRSEEKIRECTEKHLTITDDCTLECSYKKGAIFPEEIKVNFPNGVVAAYYFNYVDDRNKL